MQLMWKGTGFDCLFSRCHFDFFDDDDEEDENEEEEEEEDF